MQDSRGSQIVGVGDSRDRVAGTPAHFTQADAVPLRKEEYDDENWDEKASGHAKVDALGDFVRFSAIGDVSGLNIPVESIPARCPGTLPMAGQSARRTRSPRSDLRV